jgi:hypothetical protein
VGEECLTLESLEMRGPMSVPASSPLPSYSARDREERGGERRGRRGGRRGNRGRKEEQKE